MRSFLDSLGMQPDLEVVIYEAQAFLAADERRRVEVWFEVQPWPDVIASLAQRCRAKWLPDDRVITVLADRCTSWSLSPSTGRRILALAQIASTWSEAEPTALDQIHELLKARALSGGEALDDTPEVESERLASLQECRDAVLELAPGDHVEIQRNGQRYAGTVTGLNPVWAHVKWAWKNGRTESAWLPGAHVAKVSEPGGHAANGTSDRSAAR